MFPFKHSFNSTCYWHVYFDNLLKIAVILCKSILPRFCCPPCLGFSRENFLKIFSTTTKSMVITERHYWCLTSSISGSSTREQEQTCYTVSPLQFLPFDYNNIASPVILAAASVNLSLLFCDPLMWKVKTVLVIDGAWKWSSLSAGNY